MNFHCQLLSYLYSQQKRREFLVSVWTSHQHHSALPGYLGGKSQIEKGNLTSLIQPRAATKASKHLSLNTRVLCWALKSFNLACKAKGQRWCFKEDLRRVLQSLVWINPSTTAPGEAALAASIAVCGKFKFWIHFYCNSEWSIYKASDPNMV